MDLQLADKVAFITGASGGIGRALAETFAEEGASVVLHGHRQWDELQAWLGDQAWSERALPVRADVTSPEELAEAFGLARERFGRIDICVPNAGVWPPEDHLLHRSPESRIRGVLDVNLFGAIWTARAFLSSLEGTGARPDGHGASLCFIGSTAGRFGEKNHAEYSVSKAGLYGLVRTLKNEIVELDPYGRVNMVEPGWTVTHMAREALDREGAITGVTRTMPLRQLARAADIARTVVCLSSHTSSRHVSGQVMTVAGGMEGRVLWGPEDIDEDAVRARLDVD